MYPSYNDEHNTLKMHLFEVPTLKKKKKRMQRRIGVLLHFAVAHFAAEHIGPR